MNIAILPRSQRGACEGVWDGNRYASPGNITEIMDRCGVGLTLILTRHDYHRICQVCDGLIVPGSNTNIDPTYYGGQPFDPPEDFDEYAVDRVVIEEFYRAGKPIFGICGGMQALNVFFGGTLRQVSQLRDLAVSEEHHVFEILPDRGGNLIKSKLHPLNVAEDSFVYDVFRSTRCMSNTYHSWALDRVAPVFRVVATSDDGIVEAVENRQLGIFAVQWHPELTNRMGDPVELKFLIIL